MDKISIIIPCYNVEKYVGECLESILSQRTEGAGLQLICVNDASTDDTLKILKEYEAKYPEVIIIVNLDNNMGQGFARNVAWEYISGNYIVYVDSDDRLAPGALELLYQSIKENDCQIASGAFYFFDNGTVAYEKGRDYVFDAGHDDRFRFVAENIMNNTVCARMYTRKFLEDNKICFPEGLYMEDIYFWSLCVMYVDKCSFISSSVYGYRQNQDSTMHKAGREMKAFDGYRVEELLCEELCRRGDWGKFDRIMAPVYFMKAFVRPFEGMGELDAEKLQMLQEVKKSLFTRFPDFNENGYVLADKSEKTVMYRRLLNEI